MKKLILMLFLVVGGVMSASADGELYLRSGLKGGSWTENLSAFQFSKQWDAGNSQDIYELSIGADKLQDATDFYFRLYRNGNSYETCPYNNSDYKYVFSNGQNETYSATSGSEFQGTASAFCVEHSKIKASEYKITVYVKYNDPWEYYIKVDIVSMPVTVSSAGYATFSSDYALDFTSATNIKAYVASSTETGKVRMSAPATPVPANTGLFLQSVSGGEVTENIPVVETGDAAKPATNYLHATDGATDLNTLGDVYVFANQGGLGFYKVAASLTPAKGKAYLKPSVSAARFTIAFDDEATGIANVREVANNKQFFNLNGQRVAQPQKGLYIVNGKKMLMK